MKLTEIPALDFDLAKTLDSGQVFHWEKIGDGFIGTIGDLVVQVKQCDDFLEVRCGVTPQPTRETPALPRTLTKSRNVAWGDFGCHRAGFRGPICGSARSVSFRLHRRERF